MDTNNNVMNITGMNLIEEGNSPGEIIDVLMTSKTK